MDFHLPSEIRPKDSYFSGNSPPRRASSTYLTHRSNHHRRMSRNTRELISFERLLGFRPRRYEISELRRRNVYKVAIACAERAALSSS